MSNKKLNFISLSVDELLKKRESVDIDYPMLRLADIHLCPTEFNKVPIGDSFYPLILLFISPCESLQRSLCSLILV